MDRILIALLILGSVFTAAPAALGAGKPIDMPGSPAISGIVTCKDRVDLPGMAMLHVEVLDASGRTPGLPVVGKDSVWLAGGKLPASFRIVYDPSRIDPTHVYIVRARVRDGDKDLLLSTTPYYVLTKGAPSKVEIVVVPARVIVR